MNMDDGLAQLDGQSNRRFHRDYGVHRSATAVNLSAR
jgi:hypothetical protein